jgi:predicted RNA binding protein YcfA (HicA-like mRNA interferase family)
MPKIPGVNHLDAVRALEKAGFRIVRQGKHIVMSDGVRVVTIPPTLSWAVLRATLGCLSNNSKNFFDAALLRQSG